MDKKKTINLSSDDPEFVIEYDLCYAYINKEGKEQMNIKMYGPWWGSIQEDGSIADWPSLIQKALQEIWQECHPNAGHPATEYSEYFRFCAASFFHIW